jgi:HSP20 family protein
MAVIRWEPTRELASIQSEMNRLFNNFFEPTPSGDGAFRRWAPAMDVVETDDHYVLKADLPGLSEGDVKIEVEDNVLTISGERKANHEEGRQGYYRVERAYGAFSRTLTLPEGIQADSINATFDRGVLEVTVPKPEQRKPRKVEIAVGASQPAIEGSESDGGAGRDGS